jgi:hypothetical protein
MDIYQKIKSLKLPEGKYVVVAGSALEGYGIRKSKDIDVTVTKEVYESLKHKGWGEVVKPSGLKVLIKDNCEIGTNCNYGNYQVSTQKLIKTATIISGVPLANLNEIIKFKLEINRNKDRKDIKLIEQYLNIHPELIHSENED